MDTPELQHFAQRARRYCELVERAHRSPLEQRLREFSLALAELYAAALRLPDAEPPDEEAPDKPVPPVPTADVGQFQYYWDTFDPYEPLQEEREPEANLGDLSDDLLDTYTDLQRGLYFFDRGAPGDLAAAAWEWTFHFETHWGLHHAPSALRALQWAQFHLSHPVAGGAAGQDQRNGGPSCSASR